MHVYHDSFVGVRIRFVTGCMLYLGTKHALRAHHRSSHLSKGRIHVRPYCRIICTSYLNAPPVPVVIPRPPSAIQGNQHPHGLLAQPLEHRQLAQREATPHHYPTTAKHQWNLSKHFNRPPDPLRKFSKSNPQLSSFDNSMSPTAHCKKHGNTFP